MADSSDAPAVSVAGLVDMVVRLSDMVGTMAREQAQAREVLADLLQNQRDITALLGEHAKQIAALQARLTQPAVH